VKKNKEITQGFLPEINIARGMAIILVVAGHSFPDSDYGVFHGNQLYVFIHAIITAFHMPLFFFLSGFVFRRKFESMITFRDRFKVVGNKLKRLMIPYVVLALVTLALKEVFSSYAYHKFDVNDIWKIFIGKTPNGGLWFLWALFVITLIFLFFNKIKSYMLVGVFWILYLFQNNELVVSLRLNPIFTYGIYFAIGILFAQNYFMIAPFIKSRKKMLLSLTWITFLLVFTGNYYILYNLALNFMIDLLGIFACLITAICICSRNNKIYAGISVLGTYSYDIYLLSYFVQIPIRVIFYLIIGIQYEICVLLMFVLGILVPIIISKYGIKELKRLKRKNTSS
jgi:exopolysaccharide production protein ExoZ